MVSETTLKEAGYVQFPAIPVDSEGVECHFQKRFDDEIGKKYFITVDKYAPIIHSKTGEPFGPAYEFTMQLCDKVTDAPVNIRMFGGWELDAAEKRAEEIWHMGCWDYYERFGED